MKNDTTRKARCRIIEACESINIANLQINEEGNSNSRRSEDSENNSVNAPHIRQRLYWTAISRMGNTKLHGHNADTVGRSIEQGQAESRMFKLEGSSTDWIKCRDGKHRPIPKGIKPVLPTKPSVKSVVDGLPNGMVHSGDNCNEINANETQEARKIRLHGYGNAIVPQVAALFIESVLF